MLNREEVNLAHRANRRLRRARIVCIQHNHIAFILRREDPFLGQRIILKAAVPVQMVRGNVQDDGNAGMKALRALQLKARNLEHRPGLIRALVDQLHHRNTNVSAHQRRLAGLLKNLAHQRRSSGLAVRSGNGQRAALEEPRRQFQFTDHRQPKALHLRQFGRIQRHARAHHDQVLAAKRQQPVPAGLDHNAFVQ